MASKLHNLDDRLSLPAAMSEVARRGTDSMPDVVTEAVSAHVHKRATAASCPFHDSSTYTRDAEQKLTLFMAVSPVTTAVMQDTLQDFAPRPQASLPFDARAAFFAKAAENAFRDNASRFSSQGLAKHPELESSLKILNERLPQWLDVKGVPLSFERYLFRGIGTGIAFIGNLLIILPHIAQGQELVLSEAEMLDIVRESFSLVTYFSTMNVVDFYHYDQKRMLVNPAFFIIHDDGEGKRSIKLSPRFHQYVKDALLEHTSFPTPTVGCPAQEAIRLLWGWILEQMMESSAIKS